MEELNATTIYWLISIGLMVGYVMDLLLGRRGLSLVGNLAGGVLFTVILGIVVILLNFFGALIYAAVGAAATLFLTNIFMFEPEYKDATKIADQ